MALYSVVARKRVLEPEFIEKRLLWAGKIAMMRFLAKRYFKVTRRLFSSCNQPHTMSETASHSVQVQITWKVLF